MRATGRLGLGALLVTLVLCHAQIGAQSPRVHFVGIADTDAPGVGPHVKAALSKASSAMLGRMPRERYEEHTALTGPRCEIKTIKEEFRNLQIAAGDTVVVYYAGHGAFDPGSGTRFLPQANQGQTLRMQDIIEAVKRKQPHLVVMLVDCCQTPVSGPKARVPGTFGAGLPSEVPPLEQSLFFDAPPGTIILFATERSQPVPCGIPDNGAIKPGTLFSEALEHTVQSAKLGGVGWIEFGAQVKSRVNTTFAQHSRDAQGNLLLSSNQRADIKHQRVWAQMIAPNGKVSTIIEPKAE